MNASCCACGWVFVELSTIPTVKPCQSHRPLLFERWSAGIYRPSGFPLCDDEELVA